MTIPEMVVWLFGTVMFLGLAAAFHPIFLEHAGGFPVGIQTALGLVIPVGILVIIAVIWKEASGGL